METEETFIAKIEEFKKGFLEEKHYKFIKIWNNIYEEKLKVAEKSSDSILRKLRHLHAKAKTAEQKKQFREMAKNIALIPENCYLPMKARLIRRFLKFFYL